MPEYSLEYTLEDLPNLLMLPVEGKQGGDSFIFQKKYHAFWSQCNISWVNATLHVQLMLHWLN